MIAILLCIYNGERYLNEQIDSLLEQTYGDFKIYVHDDGSTDKSVDIVKSYMQVHPCKIEIVDDPQKHRGAGASFMWMLQRVESDYYMFCDQDDKWLPDKVKDTYARMQEVESQHPDVPVLIHTDLSVCDGSLNVVHPSFWQYQNFKVDVSKKKQFIGFGNIVTGCTVMVNRKVREIAYPFDESYIHDYWLALCVAKYGYVDNLKQQTMLYRQHGDNVAGAGRQYHKSRVGIKGFFRYLSVERKRVKKVAGFGLFRWFIYRTVYFYYRHFR